MPTRRAGTASRTSTRSDEEIGESRVLIETTGGAENTGNDGGGPSTSSTIFITAEISGPVITGNDAGESTITSINSFSEEVSLKFRKLCKAVKRNQLEKVKILLRVNDDEKNQSDVGVDITQTAEKNMEMLPEGGTVLHLAARKRDKEAIQVLEVILKHQSVGEIISIKDNYERTPLMYAVACGNEKAVKLLLSKGADCSSKDKEGRSVLQVAAEIGEPKVFELIMDHLKKGREDTASQVSDDLQAALISKDNRKFTPLMAATYHGNLYCFEKLLRENEGVDLGMRDHKNRTLLHLAVKQDSVDILKILLGRLGDPIDDKLNAKDASELTPLMTAIRAGSKQCIKHLIPKKTNRGIVNELGNTIYHLASESGNNYILRFMLLSSQCQKLVTQKEENKAGREPSGEKEEDAPDGMRMLKKEKTIAIKAAKEENITLRDPMLICGITETGREPSGEEDENAPDGMRMLKEEKKTAIKAAKEENITLRDLMLICGITDGKREVEHIMKINYLQTRFKEEFHRSGFISKPNEAGCNCFHFAAEHGNAETLEILYTCFAKCVKDSIIFDCPCLEDFNNHNMTPLMKAVHSSNEEATTFLIRHGANSLLSLQPMDEDTTRNAPGTVKYRWASADSSVLNHILNTPRGVKVMENVFDDCVSREITDEGSQEFKLDFRPLQRQGYPPLLIPYTISKCDRPEAAVLLNHPLLERFLEDKCGNIHYVLLFWFFAYLLYAVSLTFYSLHPTNNSVTTILFVFSVLLNLGLRLPNLAVLRIGTLYRQIEIIYPLVGFSLLLFLALYWRNKLFLCYVTVLCWLRLFSYIDLLCCSKINTDKFRQQWRAMLSQFTITLFISTVLWVVYQMFDSNDLSTWHSINLDYSHPFIPNSNTNSSFESLGIKGSGEMVSVHNFNAFLFITVTISFWLFQTKNKIEDSYTRYIKLKIQQKFEYDYLNNIVCILFCRSDALTETVNESKISLVNKDNNSQRFKDKLNNIVRKNSLRRNSGIK